VKKAQDLDLSSLATKADLTELRGATKADSAELRAELIKWAVGIGFARVAMILTVLKVFRQLTHNSLSLRRRLSVWSGATESASAIELRMFPVAI
jgi:hypothetical protein